MIPKPLFVPLANSPYWRFISGSKTVEVRQHGFRWNERTVRMGRAVVLSRGYNTPDRASGHVGRVTVAPTVVGLPSWAKEGADLRDVQLHPLRGPVFFDPDRPVIAFEVCGLEWKIPTDPEAALREGLRVGAAIAKEAAP